MKITVYVFPNEKVKIKASVPPFQYLEKLF